MRLRIFKIICFLFTINNIYEKFIRNWSKIEFAFSEAARLDEACGPESAMSRTMDHPDIGCQAVALPEIPAPERNFYKNEVRFI